MKGWGSLQRGLISKLRIPGSCITGVNTKRSPFLHNYLFLESDKLPNFGLLSCSSKMSPRRPCQLLCAEF